MQVKASFVYVLLNNIVNNIPCWTFRRAVYKAFGMKIGKGSRIMMKTVVMCPSGIIIGENSIINEYCHLDGRGGLEIGNNVSISLRSVILTASHSKSGSDFAYRTGKVVIEDNVWLGAGAMILDRSHLKYASIVSAGSVVKGVCEADSVYAGVPAKCISKRNLEGPYSLSWNPAFR